MDDNWVSDIKKMLEIGNSIDIDSLCGKMSRYFSMELLPEKLDSKDWMQMNSIYAKAFRECVGSVGRAIYYCYLRLVQAANQLLDINIVDLLFTMSVINSR